MMSPATIASTVKSTMMRTAAVATAMMRSVLLRVVLPGVGTTGVAGITGQPNRIIVNPIRRTGFLRVSFQDENRDYQCDRQYRNHDGQ